MKDAIRALRAERKRLLAAVKQVDRALKATGASEGKTRRRRPKKVAPLAATTRAAKATASGENSVSDNTPRPAMVKGRGTPVQPKTEGKKRERPSVDDLLADS